MHVICQRYINLVCIYIFRFKYVEKIKYIIIEGNSGFSSKAISMVFVAFANECFNAVHNVLANIYKWIFYMVINQKQLNN